jgi:hypothetical protein
MPKSLAVAILLCAAPAFAAVPEKGEGTITFLGGGRLLVPQSSDYLTDQSASHQPLTFAGLASFGYQFDDELHFKIEGGFMPDRYQTAHGTLTIHTIPIFFALDTALLRRKDFILYGGGGLGYALTTGSIGGVNNEANSTAAYVGLGIRYQLGGVFALVLEDRYILASSAADPNSTKSINEGGNLFLAGLMFHFAQTPDHPQHP